LFAADYDAPGPDGVASGGFGSLDFCFFAASN